jgi:hypothetical protein
MNNLLDDQNFYCCPHCRYGTEKNGGCNHIKCVNCQKDWCWLCGKEYKPGHYADKNLNGCSGGWFSTEVKREKIEIQ